MNEARASEPRAWPNSTAAGMQASSAATLTAASAAPTQRSGLAGSAALQATAAASAASKSRPQLKVSTSATSIPVMNLPTPRRVWVRRPGLTATSLTVDPDDLVDDLKSKILAKYPTSLLRSCDPADLSITIPGDYLKSLRQTRSVAPSGVPLASPSLGVSRKLSGSSTTRPRGTSMSQPKPPFKSPLSSPQGTAPLELQPDESVVAILERYFPDGMSMSEAFDVSGPLDAGGPIPSQVASNLAGQLAPTPTSSLAPSATLSRAGSTTNMSRTRSIAAGSAAAVRSASGGSVASVGTPAPPSQTPVKPRLISSPSSTKLVRRSATASTEKRPANANGEASTKGGGVLLLPRQLKLASNRSDGVGHIPTTTTVSSVSSVSSVSPLASNTHDATPPAIPQSENQDGLLELRKLYNKLPASQPNVVVPQVNVLIVEDNEINQKILETALRRNKVHCAIAKNGRDAVEKWREGGFHIILMDLQLPVMSGLEASKEIRRLETVNRIGAFSARADAQPVDIKPEDLLDHKEFKSPVIIVALTASSSAEDRSDALRAGCNDFLTKPVNLDWLQQKLLEWGCMQALIDFEGWKTWHVPDTNQAKLGNSLFRKNGLAAAAAITPSIPRPQSPRVPSAGRLGRGLERQLPRSRSSSSRRGPLSPAPV